MKERFAQQLAQNKTVTIESLAEMKNKTYHNGDAVIVGDKPLFGMTVDIDEDKNYNMTLIMLCEYQLDLYELDDSIKNNDTNIPIIRLKRKGRIQDISIG
jgi:hypothetical protein